MTIRKRLARSNLIMILIPGAIAAALLLLGGGLAVLLLKRVYLPRLGLSMAALHETGEQLEAAFDGAKTIAAIYGGKVILALLAAIGEMGSVADAAENMIAFERTVEPDARLVSAYEEIYDQFKREFTFVHSGGTR